MSNKKAEASVESSSVSSDTVTVSENSVVFLSINEEEYSRIAQEEDSGIDEVLGDFNYYSSEVIDSLNKAGFKTILTTSKTFAFENRKGQRSYITRDTQKGKVGILLFDGKKEPKLSYGVLTDIDYLSIVEEYFKE
jgi:hypothetical protein